jgi:hypothetical protein
MERIEMTNAPAKEIHELAEKIAVFGTAYLLDI